MNRPNCPYFGGNPFAMATSPTAGFLDKAGLLLLLLLTLRPNANPPLPLALPRGIPTVFPRPSFMLGGGAPPAGSGGANSCRHSDNTPQASHRRHHIVDIRSEQNRAHQAFNKSISRAYQRVSRAHGNHNKSAARATKQSASRLQQEYCIPRAYLTA